MVARVALWTVALVAALALAAGVVYALAGPQMPLSVDRIRDSLGETGGGQQTTAQRSGEAEKESGGEGSEGEATEGEASEALSAEERGGSPEAAAYTALATEMPGIDRESVEGVYKSQQNSSWASVHFKAGEEYDNYVVFVRRGSDGLWEARRSIRADEPNSPRNELPVLREVPSDLVENRYAEASYGDPATLPAEDVETEKLPEMELSTSEKVVRRGDAPEADELEGLKEEIKSYDGVAGVYVRDLEGQGSYGVRPNESFFSASVIKIPIMAAVFRKIESGELSLDESHETTEEDWAAGAGTLQYEEPGESYTVEKYLAKMMTESDNVATNALIRLVGGPGYVNSVARDLGAENTHLYQPVSSERAAIPALDNRTTPRDMAEMLAAIESGEAVEGRADDMMALLGTNEFEDGIENGLPDGAEVKNKGGWLFKVYADAGIVEHDGERYIISIFSKYGPATKEGGEITDRISEEVWEIQKDE